MQELNRWRELEDAANDSTGHYFALQLISEVETSVARWPMEERPHRVKFFRCQACNQQTLRYHPPTLHGTRVVDVEVKCTNKECRAVLSEEWYEFARKVVEDEQRRLDQRKAGTGEGEQIPGDGVSVAEGGGDSDVEAGQGVAVVSA
jgi:hypothetical protein